MTKLTFKFTDLSFEIDAEELPAESIAFLLQYGYKQYLADGAAVSKTDEDGNERTVEEIAELKETGVNKRWNNVQSGVFPSGGGQRDPLVTETNRVAREALRAAVKKSGKKLPEDKEARKEIFEAFRAKNLARFEEIAADNLRRAAELGDVAI